MKSLLRRAPLFPNGKFLEISHRACRVMDCLNMVMHSEKCILGCYHHYTNVQCSFTNETSLLHTYIIWFATIVYEVHRWVKRHYFGAWLYFETEIVTASLPSRRPVPFCVPTCVWECPLPSQHWASSVDISTSILILKNTIQLFLFGFVYQWR